MSKSCSCCTSKASVPQASCPSCGESGVPVAGITPRNTLKIEGRRRLDTQADYFFCGTANCDVVYFQQNDKQCFLTSDCINRVASKDESPETPLCYCFKILKGEVLDEIAHDGASDVIARIERRMQEGKGCFCEKVNPSGSCCIPDVDAWLRRQGI